MAVRKFIVMKHKGQWLVRGPGANSQSFPSQDAALRAAVESANQSGKDGVPARVMLLAAKHRPAQTFWTYGEDAYPPSYKQIEPAA